MVDIVDYENADDIKYGLCELVDTIVKLKQNAAYYSGFDEDGYNFRVDEIRNLNVCFIDGEIIIGL